jgi:hypothetical protein
MQQLQRALAWVFDQVYTKLGTSQRTVVVVFLMVKMLVLTLLPSSAVPSPPRWRLAFTYSPGLAEGFLTSRQVGATDSGKVIGK